MDKNILNGEYQIHTLKTKDGVGIKYTYENGGKLIEGQNLNEQQIKRFWEHIYLNTK